MNIRCPSCKTVFRVDPARIPPGGVRARCSRCSNTFEIRADMAAAGVDGSAPETAPAGASAPAQPAAPARTAAAPAAAPAAPAAATAGAAKAPGESHGPLQGAARGAAAPGEPAAPAPRPAQPPQTPQAPRATGGPQAAAQAGGPAVGAPAQGSAAPTGTAPRPPLFGARDPAARAQRIARALVSDIVAYHPKRREECLANGTLRTEFREEIMKSWEEYVAQVGLDVAKSTPHFRNALNEILAKGQRIF